jgi:hypothetical protein
MTDHDGRNASSTDLAGRRAASADPLHRIPLLGEIIRNADELRNQLPLIGERITRTDADVLRFEARILRMVASQMEGRAQELDRLAKREHPVTPTKIKIE